MSEHACPYLFVDGVWHKRTWGGSVENVSVLVAVGVDDTGHREVIGVAEGMKEDKASWEQFIRNLIGHNHQSISECCPPSKCHLGKGAVWASKAKICAFVKPK